MRERQAAQMAVEFMHMAEGAIGKLRLIKLMYLAEREAMRRFLLPIVEDDICAMQRGMVLSENMASGERSRFREVYRRMGPSHCANGPRPQCPQRRVERVAG